ncbi:hypothetical protein ACJJTC_013191 [Scirpophaga incertulas]
MSAPGLTSEAQLRYILQWFGEFSELQKEDFLPILAAARGKNEDQLATTMAALNCQDKPVSLFQCRIKLFNEWFPTWTEEQQDRLIKGISEVDMEFGNKLQEYLTNGPPVNGDCNGFTDETNVAEVESQSVDESANDAASELIEENEQVIAQDNLPLEIAAAS